MIQISLDALFGLSILFPHFISLQSVHQPLIHLSSPSIGAPGSKHCWSCCFWYCCVPLVLWLFAGWRSCRASLCASAWMLSMRMWSLLCKATKLCKMYYIRTHSSDAATWTHALSASLTTIDTARIPMELCSGETAFNQSALDLLVHSESSRTTA